MKDGKVVRLEGEGAQTKGIKLIHSHKTVRKQKSGVQMWEVALDQDTQTCLIHLPRTHSHFFSRSFSFSFSSSPWNDGSNSPLFSPSLSLHPPPFLSYIFSNYFLFLSSLPWEVKRSDLFFALSLPFSFPCQSLYLYLYFHAELWWMWRAVYGGMFFNLLPLTKAIQLASHCLNDFGIALVKCYLW